MVFRTSSGGPGIATLTPVRASAPTTCRSETQSHKSAAIPGSVVSRSQQTVALVRVACTPRGRERLGRTEGWGGEARREDAHTSVHKYTSCMYTCTYSSPSTRVRTAARPPSTGGPQHKLQSWLAATENQSQKEHAVFPRTTMTSCSNNHSIIHLYIAICGALPV